MLLLELISSFRENDQRPVFSTQEDGVSVRSAQRHQRYQASLVEALSLFEGVIRGRIPFFRFQEAMTTSDFPLLFGDIMDRILLAGYREAPATWASWCKRGTVKDFRAANRHAINGGDGTLTRVAEMAPYPARSLAEARYQITVAKYGATMPFSWEAMINDGELDALKDTPTLFGRAARRTESRLAVALLADASGPHATFFANGNLNLVNVTCGASSTNPALSTAALQQALIVLSKQVDAAGEPIVIEMVQLIVPPALDVTARNILNASQIELTEAGGTSNQKLVAANWMKNRLTLVVEPYLPIISTTNGNTSWYLVANPSDGRPAFEVAFLRGHESPEIFMKSPNSQRVGGGGLNPMDGDFATDSIEYKIRHCVGGSQIDPKMAVASNGSGS